MDEAADVLGRTVAGKFRIEAHVGAGAMGDVYRARHVVLDTVVALKIMRADLAKDPAFRERFYREAKAASRLEHPSSVRVLDFGVEPDGLVYLAMEFLSGRDLLSVLRQDWPLPDERIVGIVSQMLGAVGRAHELGIVHRDIKPENIMVMSVTDDDGARHDQVKVCDFGIAKLSDPRGYKTDPAGKALTTSGALIGTPEYMSPEQARGDPLDARSDLYSVGVVLYQLLTGRVPFTGENALGVVLKQVTDEPAPPSSVRPGVHARLEAVCLKALRKRPEERYQTAREMRAELRAALGGRAPMTSDAESGASLPDAQSTPDLVSAPTLPHDEVRGSGRGRSPADVGSASHPTSDGAELTVAGLPGRRSGFGLLALVALIALAVGASFVFAASRLREGAATAPSASAARPQRVAARAPSSPIASTKAERAPARPTGPSPPAPRHASADAGATATSSADASAAPPRGASVDAGAPSPPSAPSPAADAGGEPEYNPAGAYVSLGALTTERVDAAAVKAKMGELVPRLSECYRAALRMTGAPEGGSVEIHMSIDEGGRVQSSVVDAPKLPAFARCAQQALAGQSVPAGALEGAGATASQWLALHP